MGLFRVMTRLLFGRRPGRREVFRFWDGGRFRHADPSEIRRKLNTLRPDWAELVEAARSVGQPLPEAIANSPLASGRAQRAESAAHELAELVCEAFGVKALQPDGSGLTEAQRLGVLADFLSYCAGLMESTRPLH